MPVQHYEKGTYRAKIVGHVFGESKTKGTPYIEIHFQPIQATGANAFPETVYNRHLRLYLSEAAAPYSIENLRRIGWKGETFADLDPNGEGKDALVDIEISVYCGYNEDGYEDWNLTAPGGDAPVESSKGLPSKLDKIFGKALKASKPKSSKASKQETVPPDDDDEVPF